MILYRFVNVIYILLHTKCGADTVELSNVTDALYMSDMSKPPETQFWENTVTCCDIKVMTVTGRDTNMLVTIQYGRLTCDLVPFPAFFHFDLEGVTFSCINKFTWVFALKSFRALWHKIIHQTILWRWQNYSSGCHQSPRPVKFCSHNFLYGGRRGLS